MISTCDDCDFKERYWEWALQLVATYVKIQIASVLLNSTTSDEQIIQETSFLPDQIREKVLQERMRLDSELSRLKIDTSHLIRVTAYTTPLVLARNNGDFLKIVREFMGQTSESFIIH